MRSLGLLIGWWLGCGVLAAQSPPAASLGAPRAASLGSPVRASAPAEDDRSRSPAASLGNLGVGKPLNGVTLGPIEDAPEEAYNWGVVTQPWKPTRRATDTRNKGGDPWFQKSRREDEIPPVGLGGEAPGSNFASDEDFASNISPTSNPFLAEDPRKLTELRPIFMYQTIPSGNTLYRGGNLQTFTLQGRLGLTENLSLVVNKLGLLVINPGGRSLLDNETGITELWLGPKYTFYRNCEAGTIAAGGLIFQIPIGPSSIYQDTGSLGLTPYLTVAQKFGRSSYGQFQVLDTLGYHFGTSSQRSDFFYNTLHLSYDVASLGKFFPFVELNYFYYASNGTARPNLDFEARDLGMVGAPVRGRNNFSVAVGSRFKVTPGFEFGIVGEFPLNGTKDLLDFRFGVDCIFRF